MRKNKLKNKKDNEAIYWKEKDKISKLLDNENIKISEEDNSNQKFLNKSFNQKKRDREGTFEDEIKDSNKKIKSEGDKKDIDNFKYIFKKVSDFGNIYANWNKKIKSLKMEEGKIVNKLSSDELILKFNQDTAIQKLKKLEKNDIDKIVNILSYDNTNPSLLYFCFKKIIKVEKLKKLLNKYKFCLSDKIEITDYYDQDKKKVVDLQKEFDYNFIFHDESTAKNKLKDSINHLIELVSNYNDNYFLDKIYYAQLETENKNNIFIYEYDFYSFQ